MPQPPKPGESQSDFMGRCVPVFVDEGRPQKQAVAICYDMWRKKHPSSKSDEDLEEYSASGNHQDFVPQQNVMSRDYELDDIIEYNGKIGKIVKVID